MSSKGRGQHRKNCLLAFIEDCLNDSSMNHLIRWSDKSKEIFQVLWVHAGRSNYYRKTQGCLFDLYREYRGRGMTSDPKQAFRMALKKSPCIKAVSSPNIQEDWRTFQIVLKCHQQSLDNSICVPGEAEKNEPKISNSGNNVKLEEQSYTYTQDLVKEDDEKRISPVNKIRIPDVSYEKSLSSFTNNQNDSHANFGFQNNYDIVNQNNVGKQIYSSFSSNENMNLNSEQEETVCCKNPCCRFSFIYDTPEQIVRNANNKLSNQLISQRNSSTFSSSMTTNPYSMPLDDNHILGSYFPISVKAQEELGSFTSNTNPTTSITNTKTNVSQCPWRSSTIQPDDYSLSFQTPYDCDYNNEPSRNPTKYCQAFESDFVSSYFKPGEDLSQKNFSFSDYDNIYQDTEQDADFIYSRQDLYSKNNAQHYQYKQQMVPCNWM